MRNKIHPPAIGAIFWGLFQIGAAFIVRDAFLSELYNSDLARSMVVVLGLWILVLYTIPIALALAVIYGIRNWKTFKYQSLAPALIIILSVVICLVISTDDMREAFLRAQSEKITRGQYYNQILAVAFMKHCRNLTGPGVVHSLFH